MLFLQVQIVGLILISSTIAISTIPPSFHPKTDKNAQRPPNPLKFEYGYKIADPSTGGTQVREEQRDGVYALGRYYVEGGGSSQKVEYLADNWGFHPYIEYSNVGPHSRSVTQIAFGEEAVRALHSSGNNNKNAGDTKHHALHHVQKLHKAKVLKPPTPPPATQQIPVYFIQSAPQNYQMYPDPQQHVQTTILVPVKNTIDYTDYGNNPQQTQTQAQPQVAPSQYYLSEPVPTIEPQLHQESLIYEPIPQHHHSVVLQNVQDNIQHQQQQIHSHQLLQQQLQQEIVHDPPPPQNTYNASTPLNFATSPPAYGAQINAKLTLLPGNHNRLIESTKDLVTAQDVININESIDNDQQQPHFYSHSTTANSASYFVRGSTTPSPIAEALRQQQQRHPQQVRLSEQPIVVEDLAENNLGAEEVYSTTENTVRINEKTVAGALNTEPTVLVTPRPLGTNLLAPINAAIQLQSLDEEPTVKKPKHNVVVEVQKSVPYYLGKFEFVQNQAGATAGSGPKYGLNAETDENIELGKSILAGGFDVQPTVQALLYNDQTTNTVTNDQSPEHAQINYQYVPAQSLEQPEKQTLLYPVLGKQQLSDNKPTVVYPIIEKPVPYMVPVTKLVPQTYTVPVPVEVPKYIDRPYPVFIQPTPAGAAVSPYTYAPFYQHGFATGGDSYTSDAQTTNCHTHQHYAAPSTSSTAQSVPTKAVQPYSHGIVTHLTKVPTENIHHQNNHHTSSTTAVNNKPSQSHNQYYKTLFNHNHYGGLVPPALLAQSHYKVPHFRQAPSAQGGASAHGGSGGNYAGHSSHGLYGSSAALAFHHSPHLHAHLPKKIRQPRQGFASKNLRIEYGFMPPLIPSVEIDENGKPIDKHDP